MNNKILLPICEPMYSTYHYEVCGSAVVSKNPSLKNWYLNNAAVLRCHREFMGKFTSPGICIKNSSFMCNPYIDKIEIPLKYIPNLKEAIINLLSDGYYVFCDGIDDYYIQGKTWYKSRHFIHDGLIFGYDFETSNYNMYAYDETWILRPFETNSKGVSLAKNASFKKGYFGKLYGIKPRLKMINIDVNQIKLEIAEHLDSSWNKYPAHVIDYAYGTVVHEYMALYLYKLIIGAVPYESMDWRIFRVLWEHKKIMLERLIAVEKELFLDNSISEQYKNILKTTNTMRMLYASHHMKRRDSLLSSIHKMLLDINEKEKRILDEFLNKIERE